MATLAPNDKCLVCGQPLEFEVDPNWHHPKNTFGPTRWRQKPDSHACPPSAVDAWVDRVFRFRDPPLLELKVR